MLRHFPKAHANGRTGRAPAIRWPRRSRGSRTGLMDATLTGKPYPIKGWVVYGQNVLESIPQREKTLKAIEELDLMVVVDICRWSRVNYADLVLPEATYLERYDMPAMVAIGQAAVHRVAIPAVEPMYESKPGWWIAKQMAKRLGLEAWFPWHTPEQHLATLIEPLGIDARRCGCGAQSHFPDVLISRTVCRRTVRFRLKAARSNCTLRTQGVGLRSDATLHPPVADVPTGYFRLIYGRAPVHSFARNQNKPR